MIADNHTSNPSLAARGILLFAGTFACLLPGFPPPFALGAGLAFALFIGNPYHASTVFFQRFVLQASLIGLGCTINLRAALHAGGTGAWLTAGTVLVTLVLGWLFARWLKVEQISAQLIAAGTAICGGSAIAALGPVLGASSREMSVSLAAVFLLNAVALVLFPFLGHWAQLDSQSFGAWCAMAIHDTSSVAGAAAHYSPEALAVAVPMKLARALWILPLLGIFTLLARKSSSRAKLPWFIAGFVLASALATFVPSFQPLWQWIGLAGRSGLTAALFLIGASLSRDALGSIGWRPLAHAVLLWIVVGSASLFIVQSFAFP